ncbi:helix-turn-helix domain-containing protein [Sphingobacterium ginsenosidimutans]|uniref:Helix-turn-helix domain-containing protein n=1 Tax=Sphingobacterium ginsenosidimutans TaxID=687845 RepID=A0ABP8ABX7_9SPHI
MATLEMRDAIELLGGKWKLLILQSLSFGTKRFKDLQEALVGISSKVLSKDLQELEQNLLVTRTVNNTKPITVSYSLTEYAYETIPVFEALFDFGAKHRKKMKNK